jgi:DNA-binding GntR family transcriptional regulator
MGKQPGDAPARDSSSLYAEIHSQIVQGSLRPGAVLTEAALTASYEVSRTPVRSALAHLEQDGLLDRSARGYTVRQRSAEEVVEIFEARIILELAVAETAAIRHTVLDLARLTHIHEQAENSLDGPELIALNNTFHIALRQAAHNRAIADLMQRLDAQLAVYDSRTRGSTDDKALTYAEHGRILDAVRARDSKRAQEEMSVHVSRSRDLRIDPLARGE